MNIVFYFPFLCFTNITVLWQNAEHKAAPVQEILLQAEQPLERLPEQKSQTAVSEVNDEFVPGTLCKLAKIFVTFTSSGLWLRCTSYFEEMFTHVFISETS